LLLTTLLFLDISGGELFIIIIAAFILFGPKRLPEIARKIGKVVHDIKKASENITKEIKDEADKVKNDVNDVKDKIL
jgi:TatA/E family protein of Tat protein translocase